MKKIVAFSLFLCLLLCGCSGRQPLTDELSPDDPALRRDTDLPPPAASPTPPDEKEDEKTAPFTLFLVGDSTIAEYGDAGVVQRNLNGWGMPLKFNYLDDGGTSPLAVTNLGESGASSLTYTKSERYQTLLESIMPGDFVLIQFGHNDEGDGAGATSAALPRRAVNENGQNAAGTYSFEWVLYEKFIKPVLDAGAHPILCSPITYRALDGQPNISQHTAHRKVIAALADEFSLPFFDLTEETNALYRSLFSQSGAAATAKLHAFTDSTHATVDNTHLSPYGAYLVAGLAAENIRQSVPNLALYLLPSPIEVKEP